jgi:hypothetical protein
MPDYEQLAVEIGRLVAEKQAAYGDAFGKAGQVLRVLYPEGVKPEQLDDALTVVRVVDKLFRIATNRDALGENPWRDIAGYALLSVARRVETEKTCGALRAMDGAGGGE